MSPKVRTHHRQRTVHVWLHDFVVCAKAILLCTCDNAAHALIAHRIAENEALSDLRFRKESNLVTTCAQTMQQSTDVIHENQWKGVHACVHSVCVCVCRGSY